MAVERPGVRELCAAAAAGELSHLRRILAERPELVRVDLSPRDERRALHLAVRHRQAEVVRLLLAAGADPHQGVYPHRSATTPLVLAREQQWTEGVALIEAELQRRQAELSCPNTTITPDQERLHQALRAGDEATALALLEARPDLRKVCALDGATPLHLAADYGRLAVAEWLVNHRASLAKPDLAGRTPLDRATDHPPDLTAATIARRLAVARFLLAAGAPPTPAAAVALGDLVALRRFCETEPERLQAALGDRGGLLTIAVVHRQREALELLLAAGLDPDEAWLLPDLEEPTYTRGQPLWHAAKLGDIELAARLLRAGADPNAQVYASGDALFCAYGNDDRAMLDLLQAHGARAEPCTYGLYGDLEAARPLLAGDDGRDTTGADCVTNAEILVWSAACGGWPDLLAEALVRVDRAPDDPWWHSILCQPLRLWQFGRRRPSDQQAYVECFRLLLERGVDVDAPSPQGWTVAHDLAAAAGWPQPLSEALRLDFARLLLARRPDLTLRDDLLRSTPLGWAARWGRLSLVELLLDHGAPVEEPDAEPWATPLARAEMMGHPAVTALLLRR